MGVVVPGVEVQRVADDERGGVGGPDVLEERVAGGLDLDRRGEDGGVVDGADAAAVARGLVPDHDVVLALRDGFRDFVFDLKELVRMRGGKPLHGDLLTIGEDCGLGPVVAAPVGAGEEVLLVRADLHPEFDPAALMRAAVAALVEAPGVGVFRLQRMVGLRLLFAEVHFIDGACGAFALAGFLGRDLCLFGGPLRLVHVLPVHVVMLVRHLVERADKDVGAVRRGQIERAVGARDGLRGGRDLADGTAEQDRHGLAGGVLKVELVAQVDALLVVFDFAEVAREERRAVEERVQLGVAAVEVFRAELHRDVDGELVAGLPVGVQHGVFAGLAGGDLLSVERERHGTVGPAGAAHVQRELLLRSLVEREDHVAVLRILRVHGEFKSAVRPLQFRGDEERDVQVVVVVEIDRVVVLRVVLDARAEAAPEGLVGRAVHTELAGPQRDEVGEHGAFGVLRRQDLVQQGAFAVVAVDGVRRFLHLEMLGEADHVVDVAALDGGGGEVLVRVGGAVELLAVAVAAGAVGVILRDDVEEVLADLSGELVAGHFVVDRLGDDFRHLRVRVLAGEVVLARSEVVHEPVVAEPLRERLVRLVLRFRVELPEDFAEAAELHVEHALAFLFVQALREAVDPACEVHEHVLRLFVSGDLPRVVKPFGDLVLRVPRRPRVVDRFHVAVLQHLERAAGVPRHTPDVAGVPVELLAARHLADDVVHALLEPRVARAGVFQRKRRQVVPERVAGEVAAFPAAVDRSLRRLAAILVHARHKAVRAQREQEIRVALLVREERAVEELDFVEPEWDGAACAERERDGRREDRVPAGFQVNAFIEAVLGGGLAGGRRQCESGDRSGEEEEFCFHVFFTFGYFGWIEGKETSL